MSPPQAGDATVRTGADGGLGPGPRLRACALVVLSLLAAGCGSTSIRSAGTAHGTPAVSPSVRREEQQIHAQVTRSLHQLADANLRYGGIPSFIPRGGHAINRVLDASPQHPALSIEGDAIRMRIATGSGLATMVGPYIPRRWQGTAVRQAPATITLTFTRAAGALPINPRAFSIVDEQGTVLRPLPRSERGGVLPRSVPAGRPFTVRFDLILPIGNGTLRYTPGGSGHFLAAWDFDVETD